MKLMKIQAGHYTCTGSDGTRYRIVRRGRRWSVDFAFGSTWVNLRKVAQEYGFHVPLDWNELRTKTQAVQHLERFLERLETGKHPSPESMLNRRQERHQLILRLVAEHLDANGYRTETGAPDQWTVWLRDMGGGAMVRIQVPADAIRYRNDIAPFFTDTLADKIRVRC